MSYRVPSSIDAIAKQLSELAKNYDKEELLNRYFEVKKNCSNGDCKELKTIKEKLFACYVLLIVKIALKVVEKHNIPFSYQEDVYQEAFKAFNVALEKFKPEKGYQFSTYLHKVVFNQINKFIINNLHLVRNKKFSYGKAENEEKYEFLRLDELNTDKVRYENDSLSGDFDEIFDGELFNKILKAIYERAPSLYYLYKKVINGEPLTRKEKELFKKTKNRVRNFIKREFGINSFDEFYF